MTNSSLELLTFQLSKVRELATSRYAVGVRPFNFQAVNFQLMVCIGDTWSNIRNNWFIKSYVIERIKKETHVARELFSSTFSSNNR